MKSVCLIGDVPPPFSGPEIGMGKLLRSRVREVFRLHHFGFQMNATNLDRGTVNIKKLLHFAQKLSALNRLLRTHHVDCVYYYFSQTLIGLLKDTAVISVASSGGRKLVLHLRGSNFRRFYNTQCATIKRIIRYNFNRAEKILVQSECLLSMFDGIVPEHRLGVLYNGLEKWEISTQQIQIKKEEPAKIFFMGQLSYSKGYVDLVLALPKIVEQVDSIKLFLAGERIPLKAERNIHLKYIAGWNSPETIYEKALNTEKELAQHIEYLGVIDPSKRRKILSESAIFVLPTYSEGFSNAVLEAMGYGLPVITTPVGAHPDIFRETPEVMITPGRPDELAERIVRLLKDSKLRLYYGKHNLNLVRERYTMNSVADQFIHSVESIC